MNAIKRILAGLTFLICLAMIAACVYLGVGIWVVKEPITVRAVRTFKRIEAALDIGTQKLDHVRTSLIRAAERLDSARAEQRKIAEQPQQRNVIRQTLARTVRQQVAPDLSNATEMLHSVAEAAVVVNAVLEDVGNFPFIASTGLDVKHLEEMNRQLGDIGPRAWELSRLLGEQEPQTAAEDQEFTRMEATLKTMQGMIADFEPRLVAVRHHTAQLQIEFLTWITPVSIATSVICFWIVVSQVSLMIHACRWWKRLGTDNQPVS